MVIDTVSVLGPTNPNMSSGPCRCSGLPARSLTVTVKLAGPPCSAVASLGVNTKLPSSSTVACPFCSSATV